MIKLISSLLVMVAIVAVTLWFMPQLLSKTGLDRYIQPESLPSLEIFSESSTNKCTTVNGEVIYGTISNSEDCEQIESIETHITIIESVHLEEDSILSSIKPLFDTTHFRCDGRTQCSQMTSCEEAKFFLANCNNMKVDGDQDGVPCERQWCR